MSLRFFVGDDNGFLKSITCLTTGSEEPPVVKTLDDTRRGDGTKSRHVDRMAFNRTKTVDERLIAVGRADGSIIVHDVPAHGVDEALKTVHEWKEPRMKATDHFVGLGFSDRNVYSCTTSGHLRLTNLPSSSTITPSSTQKASLPMRLCDFRLSPDTRSFAYGGDEVDLSVWDAERAFAPSNAQAPESGLGSQPEALGQKRKKPSTNDLLPGEIWRAKNLPNDTLSLRQPVHVSSLTFLPIFASDAGAKNAGPSHHIVTGSRLGSVRRYDTRAARRPVANWTHKEYASGVRKVEAGCAEHEVFVSNSTSHLFSVDTRTGRILCGYKGISGAVSSLAPTPHGLASTSLDRFVRLHKTYAPPSTPGAAQIQVVKGETVVKEYVKSTPTAIVWDEEFIGVGEAVAGEGDVGEMWEDMEIVGGEEDEDSDAEAEQGREKSRRRRKEQQ